ncbi:MAG: DUF4231 domain-containing protein [Nostoc sp. DedVER02]|uniref:DUF4231 domain-containing protein n=1 Tax=unclassified Nostoc TaxID=2593658 RepID=UPI002AD589F5|nr:MULTISPECIES: DUF4231 domain-containing protein [unclassified Nostoc]MDZ7985064.1 DUF4231 domain-containing protein [Nostoc sp. DedVER02]MDZ8113099.1 DUF4231 domain-containing protein [Nostoc sp. DedVER01b]
MGKKEDYSQYLRQVFCGLIDRLDLSDLRKDFLKNRWLDQLMWLEGRATKERNAHHNLRMITIIGGVIVPALIGFQKGNQKWQEIVGWSAFGLSQVVAVSAAVEEFFGHGEKYRNYRNTAEGLKIEGWQFFQMAGPYRQFNTHSEAYTIFAERVEQYIQQDLQGFISQLTERQEAGTKQTQETVTKNAELALEKLNEQLQLRAQYEAQLKELEAEKQRVQAERQQLEQERDDAKPALLTAQEDSDKQPDLSPVGNLLQEDEEDRDSTSLNPNSVQYLSANEILVKIKSNPISKNGTATNQPTETKQVSTSLPMCGVELIKKFEGCYLNAYKDPLSGGLPITIGWGTTRKRDGSPWYMGDSISQQQADELLIYQLETSYLPDLMKIPYWSELNPNQQGALLSFGYNLGSKFYGLSNFESMTRVLKNRDWANIRETFIKYRNPGSNVEQGLRRRREAEADLFLKPYA